MFSVITVSLRVIYGNAGASVSGCVDVCNLDPLSAQYLTILIPFFSYTYLC